MTSISPHKTEIKTELRTPKFHESPQRKAMERLLRQGSIPGLIKFGAGSPDEASFPKELIAELQVKVSKISGILNYGLDAGFKPLIDILPKTLLARENRQVRVAGPENIAVTAGSQQSLFILGLMSLRRHSKIAVGSTAYIGALDAWSWCQPDYIVVPTDKHGVIPEELDKVFHDHPDIKFFYTGPTHQNPDGITIPLERREQIVECSHKREKIIIEDDPYSETSYDGKQPPPSLQSIAKDPDDVIYLWTTSKTLAPDFRIGGVVGNKEVVRKVTDVKRRMNLYTSNQSQAMVAAYLEGGYLDAHVPNIVKLYQPKRDEMHASVEEFFPDVFECFKPGGGLFLWPHLKEGANDLAAAFDMEEIMDLAEQNGVGFIYGSPFFPNSNGEEVAMRLNFSKEQKDNIKHGIQILGRLLHEKLEEFKRSR